MTDNPATTARRIVAAVQARGSDANDLRDAAHEAVHGLLGNLTSWERESLHRSLVERLGSSHGRVGLLSEEITARAVEAIVCDRLGVAHDIEQFAGVTLWEALHNRVHIPVGDAEFAGFVRTRMDNAETRALADRVIALGDEP